MDKLENALAQITGTAECIKADLQEDLDAEELKTVAKTYLKTLEDVKELLNAYILSKKSEGR